MSGTRKKKQRLSATECRERLIESGLQSLAELGLAIGLDAVNLERAVRDANVPRSSAYACLSDGEYSPQEAFQQAVLMRAIEARRQTKDALDREIAAFFDSPPEGLSRSELLRQLIKVAAGTNLEEVVASRSWQIVFAMRSIINTAESTPLLDEEMRAWIGKNEEILRNETIDTLYKPMAEMFRFRPRPEYGERAWHLLEISSASLSEGLSMRYRLPAGDYMFGLPHPELPDDESWSLVALLFERLVEMFFEPVDDAD